LWVFIPEYHEPSRSFFQDAAGILKKARLPFWQSQNLAMGKDGKLAFSPFIDEKLFTFRRRSMIAASVLFRKQD